MINKIFKMLNSREMAMLRVFYQQSIVINRLGMARNGNRHSAFLKWFLDPEEYHGMGYEPLRLLLRLYCSKWGMHAYGVDLTMKILAGDYKIDIIRSIAAVEASTRKLINDNSESKKPIDIWMVVDISCEIDGDTKKVVVPILVKNKTSKRKGKYQTFDYFSAGITYEKTLKHVCKFVNILLSPDGKAPRNSQYAGISYQELLDYVIEPAQVLALDHAKTIINAYINNLSSIEPGDALAISREERSLVTRFMKEHGELVHMALAAAYPGKSTAFAAPEQEFQENDKTMLLNVWNENEDILMRVICVSHPEKISKLNKLFKGNFHDNTKYRVFHRGKEIYAGEQLSKVNAAIAIFKAYVKENPNIGLDQLRSAFPCEKINYYYGHANYYSHLFYLFDDNCVDEWGSIIITYDKGPHAGEWTQIEYDFKTDDKYFLDIKDGKVMCVKMWRKGDFDRLCKWIKTKHFDYIQVEQCL